MKLGLVFLPTIWYNYRYNGYFRGHWSRLEEIE